MSGEGPGGLCKAPTMEEEKGLEERETRSRLLILESKEESMLLVDLT